MAQIIALRPSRLDIPRGVKWWEVDAVLRYRAGVSTSGNGHDRHDFDRVAGEDGEMRVIVEQSSGCLVPYDEWPEGISTWGDDRFVRLVDRLRGYSIDLSGVRRRFFGAFAGALGLSCKVRAWKVRGKYASR